MFITKKHQYGLSSMICLGMHYQTGPIQLKLISKESAIPHAYLEQLILDLKKHRLVISTRGARGGYQLAKPPSEISVYDIIFAFGPLGVQSNEDDSLAFFWNKLTDHMNQFFDVSLNSLIDDVLNKKKVLVYSI